MIRQALPGLDELRSAVFTRLTPQQKKVLALVVAGCLNKEIATRLRISERTVKWHVSRVKSHYGAESRTALVRTALRAHVERPSARRTSD